MEQYEIVDIPDITVTESTDDLDGQEMSDPIDPKHYTLPRNNSFNRSPVATAAVVEAVIETKERDANESSTDDTKTELSEMERRLNKDTDEDDIGPPPYDTLEQNSIQEPPNDDPNRQSPEELTQNELDNLSQKPVVLVTRSASAIISSRPPSQNLEPREVKRSPSYLVTKNTIDSGPHVTWQDEYGKLDKKPNRPTSELVEDSTGAIILTQTGISDDNGSYLGSQEGSYSSFDSNSEGWSNLYDDYSDSYYDDDEYYDEIASSGGRRPSAISLHARRLSQDGRRPSQDSLSPKPHGHSRRPSHDGHHPKQHSRRPSQGGLSPDQHGRRPSVPEAKQGRRGSTVPSGERRPSESSNKKAKKGKRKRRESKDLASGLGSVIGATLVFAHAKPAGPKLVDRKEVNSLKDTESQKQSKPPQEVKDSNIPTPPPPPPLPSHNPAPVASPPSSPMPGNIPTPPPPPPLPSTTQSNSTTKITHSSSINTSQNVYVTNQKPPKSTKPASSKIPTPPPPPPIPSHTPPPPAQCPPPPPKAPPPPPPPLSPLLASITKPPQGSITQRNTRLSTADTSSISQPSARDLTHGSIGKHTAKNSSLTYGSLSKRPAKDSGSAYASMGHQPAKYATVSTNPFLHNADSVNDGVTNNGTVHNGSLEPLSPTNPFNITHTNPFYAVNGANGELSFPQKQLNHNSTENIGDKYIHI